MASLIRDIIAEATFTSAITRLTKAAKKAGIDRDEAESIFASILNHHYGKVAPPAPPKP